MLVDPMRIQRLTPADPPAWEADDEDMWVGYLADEAQGSTLGLAYGRFRRGLAIDFRWPYDEVAVVTKGRLTVRTGDDVLTADPGEAIYMPAGVRGVFEAAADLEAFFVHYPNHAKAFRQWQGAELVADVVQYPGPTGGHPGERDS